MKVRVFTSSYSADAYAAVKDGKVLRVNDKWILDLSGEDPTPFFSPVVFCEGATLGGPYKIVELPQEVATAYALHKLKGDIK